VALTSNQRGLRKRFLVTLSVAVIGLAAGVAGWQLWPHECGEAQLNDKADGECIGITDGAYVFNDPDKAKTPTDRKIMENINDVQKLIKIENDAVTAGSSRYVKVALLMPLTVSQARPPAILLREILHSLEGSYVALHRANHSPAFGDPSAVKIQLLLVNQGSRQNADPDFIDGILKISQMNHPLVAVVGLGASVPNTKTAADYLAQRGIPMVSAVASADSLTHLPLLWSVSPSNTEYAVRLKSFLDQQHVLRSGVIVYDRNPDLFTQSLAQAYHDQLGLYVKFPDQPFQGSTINTPAAPDIFFPVVTNLCNAANDPNAPLDMVFYAGRVADLGPFVEALKTRTCRQRPLTMLVVTSGFAGVQDTVGDLRGETIKLGVATSADPLSLGRNEPGTPPGYEAFRAEYYAQGFNDSPNSLDGFTISHHDALATATQAIRLAAIGRPTQAPNAEDVAGQFGHLNLAYAVPAASGTLSFRSEGGTATGEPIPIEQIG